MLSISTGQSVYVLGLPITPADLPEISTYDQIFVDARDVDIKTLRQTISQFQQSPTGEVRVLVVNFADKLSELMQNTLLKIIEEPPPKGAAILHVGSVDSLLPTVRSRVTPISLVTNRRGGQQVPDLSKLPTLDRQQALEYLEQIIVDVDLSSDEGLLRHNLLNQAALRLKQNLNVKLVTDWLLLNWAQEFGKEK